LRSFDLLQPRSVDEAVALSAKHGEDARFVAGGAMLTILLRQRVIAPRYLISLSDIGELSGFRANGAALHVGAMTTLRDLERAPEIQQTWPVLAEAAHLVGNVRVRNVATLGGHLAQADAHMDLPPVLLALGATVQLRGAQGIRDLPLDDFLTGYYETALATNEMISAISVPAPPAGLHGVYLKYCSLSPNDWPTVGIATFLQAEQGRAMDVRIVAGSVADRPLRLPEAEALLVGERLSRAAVAEVGRRYAAAADPIPDVRGSVDYKRRVTDVFVQRAVAQAATSAGLDVAT